MDRRSHWNEAWATRGPESVSWYQAWPEPSLRLVKAVAAPVDPIIDVGGGASSLAGALVASGYQDVTVLDISRSALDALVARLGDQARTVRLLEADVLRHPFEPRSFALWHDRAVFHFLTEPDERSRYSTQMDGAVRPGGHAVVGTFASDGPTRCSGLPVQRYDATELVRELGPSWELVESVRHEHRTPSGTIQPFTFVLVRRSTQLP